MSGPYTIGFIGQTPHLERVLLEDAELAAQRLHDGPAHPTVAVYNAAGQPVLVLRRPTQLDLVLDGILGASRYGAN